MDAVYDTDYTHVGIACSCHDIFEEFCIIEFGQNV